MSTLRNAANLLLLHWGNLGAAYMLWEIDLQGDPAGAGCVDICRAGATPSPCSMR